MITAVESAQLRTNLRLGITRRGSRSLGAVTSISHVVLVSWKSGKEIRAEELVRPAIRGFVGYDYGFVVTFATAQARDANLDDPSHRPVAGAIGAAAERIVVFDI
jgi:hypothetical protein